MRKNNTPPLIEDRRLVLPKAAEEIEPARLAEQIAVGPGACAARAGRLARPERLISWRPGRRPSGVVRSACPSLPN
jgi:hypothetical protein